ncbi:hypothetical protein [Novosphingobium humi]|uniref:Membrane-anchored ribosome-binding protein, inhibits growth in stationary phase, ElaB/YqjD/DUF883 family n=1 Tax=Novosphingobium humi TaxID=2282397 RepID=A0ABY7U2I4_9SPHN|nr:hypothetical protein [Novosphingobium humi]WCT78414.1 hypothetical protein PQ457_05435 [Novosphingobium humi]WJS98031.1 hypothetical protein NYQ05_12955 [Novosphingobium humi]
MADETNALVADAAEAVNETAEGVKAKFSKAIDDARAGALALGKDLQEKAAPYTEKLSSGELLAEAKAIGEQAKERALNLAADGKVKASDAITSLGKVVADNAGLVDDKLGEKYGDYARSAARALQETGAKLESKNLEELGKEATEFVKKNPVIAAGALIAVGFALTKLLGGKSDEEA